MPKLPNFETKISELGSYRDSLKPPSDFPEHQAWIENAQATIDLEIGKIARRAYKNVEQLDLREDTPGVREQRVRILALMTAPHSEEEISERTSLMSSLFDRVVAGDSIEIANYTLWGKEYASQTFEADTDYPIFNTFNGDDHEVFHIQHLDARQDRYRVEAGRPNLPVLRADLQSLVKEGVLLEPVAV